MRLPARSTDIIRPTQFAAGVIRSIASPNLPNDEPLEPCRFRQKVSVSDGLRLEFDLRRDSRLQDFRATHGAQCDPLASCKLSCLSREMQPIPLPILHCCQCSEFRILGSEFGYWRRLRRLVVAGVGGRTLKNFPAWDWPLEHASNAVRVAGFADDHAFREA